jgi:hemerythrin superfamily protein
MIRQLVGRLKTGIKSATGIRYDALDLLRADHMKVERLAVELRLLKDPKRRTALLGRMRTELDRHMRLEEEIFYPACERFEPLRYLAEHAHTDHQLVKNALRDLAVMEPSSKRFSSLVTTVIKQLEHHVHEEEDRLFPVFRRLAGRKRFQEVSRAILRASAAAERKGKLRARVRARKAA